MGRRFTIRSRRADALSAMRSDCGSSLVAVVAALLIVAALAATALPSAVHPSGGQATPAPQDAVSSARATVQAANGQAPADAP